MLDENPNHNRNHLEVLDANPNSTSNLAENRSMVCIHHIKDNKQHAIKENDFIKNPTKQQKQCATIVNIAKKTNCGTIEVVEVIEE